MDENQINDNLSDIDAISQEEVRRLQRAQEFFVLEGHPVPEHRLAEYHEVTNEDVRKRFGVEIFLLVISTIGAALISAIRVGSIMEIAQNNLSQVYSLGLDANEFVGGVVFWASMAAFEGSLIAYGIYRGRTQETIKVNPVAVITAFLVTVLAGFLSSLTLLTASGLQAFTAFSFAAVSGVAASFIAFFGSENIGFIMQEIDKMQDAFNVATEGKQRLYDLEYANEMDLWQREFRVAYPRIAKQVFSVDRRRRVVYEDNGNGHHPAEEPQDPEAPQRNLRKEVREYMQKNGITPSQVGDLTKGFMFSPAGIADALGIIGDQRNDVRKYMAQFRKDEEKGRWIV